MSTLRYEAEVEIRTAAGQVVTYTGDGLSSASLGGQQLLNSVEAAALHQEPGGTVVASRVRMA
ncbi:hypothetical protein ACFV1W_37200 [Kitasatospora sp. NPDC059648]|uniref:hypothetical protein n=1 Tax=Kitasatospora sp. NPDC059648 TaxID=3346894 RepID=UPI0036BC19A3